jgi:hypothetical protein
MALPVAALITAMVSHYRTPKEVTYHSAYEGDDNPTPATDDQEH